VQNALPNIGKPRAVHDRERTQDENPAHLTEVHEVVRCPQGAHRLARAGVIEAERFAVEREER